MFDSQIRQVKLFKSCPSQPYIFFYFPCFVLILYISTSFQSVLRECSRNFRVFRKRPTVNAVTYSPRCNIYNSLPHRRLLQSHSQYIHTYVNVKLSWCFVPFLSHWTLSYLYTYTPVV